MKLPAIQLYPGDWLKDQVSGCSLAAQGLWLRMMFIMHDSEKYGYLSLNGTPMPADMVARKCGVAPMELQALLSELLDARVPSMNKDQIIYSRRMIRDAKQRKKWAKQQRKHRVKDGQARPVSQRNVSAKSALSSSSFALSSSMQEQSQNLAAPPVCGNLENQLQEAKKRISNAQRELQTNPESRGARLAFDEGTGQRRRIEALLVPMAARKGM